MNYLAHGFRHTADPWFLAGTALPDWLRVLGRRMKIQRETLEPLVAGADPRVAAIARGALRHHDDDRRFHGSVAFAETRREVAGALGAVLCEADGHRPWFVAHLVVEVQLDAAIAAHDPPVLDAYYDALATIGGGELERVVSTFAPRPPEGLARLFGRFMSERFLGGYGDHDVVVRRLDRVVRSVRQPGLPPSLAGVLGGTRRLVAERRDLLLGQAAEPLRGDSRYAQDDRYR